MIYALDEKINLRGRTMQSRRWYIFLLAAGLLFTNYWLLLDNCYAQQESVTITTYYPSPYGSYNELQSNKMAIGDTNTTTVGFDPSDQPPANGQLYVARSVIFKPQSPLPTTDRLAGEVVYNPSDGYLYAYNGSTWVKQAGGEGYQFVAFGYYVTTTGVGTINATKQDSSGQDYMYAMWCTTGLCCRAPSSLVYLSFTDLGGGHGQIYMACVK